MANFPRPEADVKMLEPEQHHGGGAVSNSKKQEKSLS